MRKSAYFIWMGILVMLTVLALPYFYSIIRLLFFSNQPILNQLSIYQWVVVGYFIFYILRRYLKNNLLFLETFSHELTHAFFAFCFNRRVHSFHAEDAGSGVIYTSGKNQYVLVPIALAPYCFPIFTYLLLSFRWIIDFHGMWIFDILIGITLCFHYYCFKTQIGDYQTDINQYPLSFSYFYIFLGLLLNGCIIIPSFFPNMNVHDSSIVSTSSHYVGHYGLFSSIYRVCETWYHYIEIFFNWLF